MLDAMVEKANTVEFIWDIPDDISMDYVSHEENDPKEIVSIVFDFAAIERG